MYQSTAHSADFHSPQYKFPQPTLQNSTALAPNRNMPAGDIGCLSKASLFITQPDNLRHNARISHKQMLPQAEGSCAASVSGGPRTAVHGTEEEAHHGNQPREVRSGRDGDVKGWFDGKS